MVVKTLEAGNYIVTWTAPNHETLSAEIEVRSTGVSCIKVTGGICGSTVAPGVNISGMWSVFGTLKPTVAPPPPTTGYISVSSTPSGASVDVNGTDIGRTPITMHELPIGPKLVTLRLSGYTPAEHSVTIAEGETAELSPPLSPIPAAEEGFLTVTSVPAGASVSIGGVSVGTTPLTDYGLPAGEKVVSVSMSGYETATRDVTITAGETSTIAVTLLEAVVPPPVAAFEDWVEQQGGIVGMKGNLIAIGKLIDGFLGIADLGFTVTIIHMGSAIDYYLGVA